MSMSTKSELEKEIMYELEQAIVANGAIMFLVQVMVMAETLDESIKDFSDDDMMSLKEVVDTGVDYSQCLMSVLKNNETDEWLEENADFVAETSKAVDGFIEIYRNELVRREMI